MNIQFERIMGLGIRFKRVWIRNSLTVIKPHFNSVFLTAYHVSAKIK